MGDMAGKANPMGWFGSDEDCKSDRTLTPWPETCASTALSPALLGTVGGDGRLVEAREREAAADGLDFRAQLLHAREALDVLLEVHELLAVLVLDGHRELRAAVQEARHLHEVRLLHAARRHGRRAHAAAARAQGGLVARHAVAVHADAHGLAHLLDLAARETERAQVPEHEVVVRAKTKASLNMKITARISAYA